MNFSDRNIKKGRDESLPSHEKKHLREILFGDEFKFTAPIKLAPLIGIVFCSWNTITEPN